MVNRDRHDITFEILRKATAGKKKTELMMEVGLSYAQSKEYLSVLVERKLLEVDEKRLFRTTSKGLEFLEKCEQCPLFKWDRRKK
jgi:predicted transcriptional regulator